MKTSEAHYRASKKYQREKTRRVTLELNVITDDDILTWMDSQENKAGYIKSLIRADMEKHK